MAGLTPFVQVKNAAPYESSQMSAVYLDPLARARPKVKGDGWEMHMAQSVVR
jgi:hypothetical protein